MPQVANQHLVAENLVSCGRVASVLSRISKCDGGVEQLMRYDSILKLIKIIQLAGMKKDKVSIDLTTT